MTFRLSRAKKKRRATSLLERRNEAVRIRRTGLERIAGWEKGSLLDREGRTPNVVVSCGHRLWYGICIGDDLSTLLQPNLIRLLNEGYPNLTQPACNSSFGVMSTLIGLSIPSVPPPSLDLHPPSVCSFSFSSALRALKTSANAGVWACSRNHPIRYSLVSSSLCLEFVGLSSSS
jgi:hypothetical protein